MKDDDDSEKSKPQPSRGGTPHDSQQTHLTEEVAFHRKSHYTTDRENVAKDYQKEVPRKLRFQPSNQNVAEFASIHKVSRSCSPKNSDLRLDPDEGLSQPVTVQTKRERYQSQRRRAESEKALLANRGTRPRGERIISGQNPALSTTKQLASSNQAYPLGNICNNDTLAVSHHFSKFFS